MTSNNFAKFKPCVVLLVQDPDNPQVLTNDDGTERVFERYTKAQKYVANRIDAELWPFITYVNVEPQVGAGDREETHNRRCLKCSGFLRPSNEVEGVTSPIGGLEVEELLCPVCDLGENPNE